MSYSVCGSLLHLIVNLIFIAVGVVWLLLIVFYGTQPWASGPLNAWHHTKDFNIFMAFGILWIFLFQNSIFNPLWAACAIPLRAAPAVHDIHSGLHNLYRLFVWGFGIFGIVMVCIDDPIVRSCTRDPQFPMHFKLNSEKNSVRGMVEVKTGEGHHGVWDMSHYPLPANPNIYSLRLWRQWEYEGDPFWNITWPEDRAVREIVYDLSAIPEGGTGRMVGFCGPQKLTCLNGTVEMEPLKLEWTYTDPITKEPEEKVLHAEEKAWQFGTKHCPWVNLRDGTNEKLVFSAPSSKWVCGGGDGDLWDAVVPVGLVMTAEQRYNKKY